jgi:hypothetical protein
MKNNVAVHKNGLDPPSDFPYRIEPIFQSTPFMKVMLVIGLPLLVHEEHTFLDIGDIVLDDGLGYLRESGQVLAA